jgi:hypothetical protein
MKKLRGTDFPTLQRCHTYSGSKQLVLHGVTEISYALDQAVLLLVLGATVEVTGGRDPDTWSLP